MSDTKPIDDGGPAEVMRTSDGYKVLIDTRDAFTFFDNDWRVGANGYVYLVGGRTKGRPCLLHRIILNAGHGQETHHINGDKLDNRRSNLLLTDPRTHQTKYHREEIISRNKLRRKHPLTAKCPECREVFAKHRDHRGSQFVCSKSCALARALRARKVKCGR